VSACTGGVMLMCCVTQRHAIVTKQLLPSLLPAFVLCLLAALQASLTPGPVCADAAGLCGHLRGPGRGP
jgi:hypothetical protein